ncbi:hypothetical protein B0H15DRAFT_843326 [Mycena belliarum]|uniref:Uncharacterized protein n=1 Tax=Mycena belliarum TaxID=1033014 RepID=A0AAD6XTY7_9AGAR|nr:hypothetical protein B0H15DRAFT_843326 [Mycena belliae]
MQSPLRDGVLFQAPPLSARDRLSGTYDHPGDSFAYDPYASDAPLLPNRRSPTKAQPPPVFRRVSAGKPPHLSLSRSAYQDFDAQPLYFIDSGKQGPFTPSSTGFANETQFLKTPLSALFPTTVPQSPRRHPFANGFEAPEWLFIVIHVFLCVAAYPVLLLFVVIGNHRTLFWSRLAVGMGCGAVGVTLGLSLTRLGQRFLEAATWATVIHQSRVAENPGIRMRDLASGSQYPTSMLAALRLLWNRVFYRGTARRARKNYDSRPWSLVVIFFLVVVLISASLPFILGRVVDIAASIQHQSSKYHEVAIFADSSDSDIERAKLLQPAFNDFTLTWTLSPFSSHGALPAAVSLPWDQDNVYFSETIRPQLLPDGSGFGTFQVNSTAASLETIPVQQTNGDSADSGAVLRYPRWGIRIHCAKFADPNAIVPRSTTGFTYIFTPRDMLRSLFSSFGLDLPTSLEDPLNTTAVMRPNDTFPIGLSANDIALAALFYDNGVAHSFKSVPMSMGEDGKGFVSIETLLVRLNTTYTPKGTFLTHTDIPMPDVNGTNTFIGVDAAVCLELYEPWVVETYNNSMGVPSTTRIASKGNAIVDANPAQEINTRPPLTDTSLKRELTSTNLLAVYDVAHGNSANQILKDNGRDAFYVPSPTLVSFSGGDGPYGYLELSHTSFGEARARADASNVLSYFAGSGQTVARCYTDRVISETKINTFNAVIVFGVVLVLGVLAGLFVPKLPMAVPRRGFELYSWIAAFYSNELVLDQIDQSEGMAKQLDVEEIEKHMGDLKFRYGF